ncbi:signal peptidase II [Athalassotoga sp.]|uniref:signal peptidase II n=1 Tax=Athalassotoga sp. TaxID=2022597 RepID=UPI003CFCFECE
MIFQWIVVLIVISVDQLTKYLVSTRMVLWESVPVVKGVVNLFYVRNTGVGFSLLAFKNDFVEYLTLAIIGGIIIFSFLWKEKSLFFRLSVGLLIGGALSNNAISRPIFGYVVDFIQIGWWPVFNVADSCVVAGAIGLGIYFLRRSYGGKPQINRHQS